jgi:hypothetical protein
VFDLLLTGSEVDLLRIGKKLPDEVVMAPSLLNKIVQILVPSTMRRFFYLYNGVIQLFVVILIVKGVVSKSVLTDINELCGDLKRLTRI